VRLARGGIREYDAFLGHEMRGPGGTGRHGVSMAEGQDGQGARKAPGLKSYCLTSPPYLFVEFAYAFRISVSIREAASEHPFCVLMYMNS
jgi:hypothetical protein